jgi:hypothetical protein
MNCARPMLETNFPDRRQIERRRHIAHCSHHTSHPRGHEACDAHAQWKCTGCGRFGCHRHRIRLENPEMCSYCTGKIVALIERGTSRRQ